MLPHTMDAYDDDEIVISGIGGHFPECDNLDEVQNNLLGGVDMVTADRPRWEPGELDVPTRTGKMKSLDKCDAQYFGLVGKQCHALDPITRKILERTYEAIFDAGLNPSDMAGSKTAVVVGTGILETEMTLMEIKSSDAYNILGRNKTMNANRISYWLDLKGPSFTLDSSWSSGLQALALGYEYIRSGSGDAALVGAGSSIIHAQYSKHFAELGLLSPDGTSKAFDESANGFARSEAVVVLVLQRLRDAKRNYGTIVHAVGRATNHSNGHILVPRPQDWLCLYRSFYDDCRVDPSRVSYFEADGLACQEADAAELNAVDEFFCRNREAGNPLLVGSVKTNVGHAAAAAGLCSLTKVLVANQTGVIPPNLHFSSPNKSIPGLVSGRMKVVTEPTRFDGEYVAVNDFGFGGTYGHCLIRRPTTRRPRPNDSKSDVTIPRLVLVSSRNEEGIEATLNKLESLPYTDECVKLVHDVFSKNITHHMYRGYTLLPKTDASIRANQSYQGEKRPVWFVFSGMGSHWATMGKDLMRLPCFKESIDICHETLKKKGLDLWHILTHDDERMFDNILNSFVSISSVQIALVDVLSRLGIHPDGIIGHSAGELGAAYADGCLTREEMILSSYSRGKVSTEVRVIKGMMAAVGLGYSDIKDRLPNDVQVACHNSSTNCTISGPKDVVNAFAEELKRDGVFVKAVNVSDIAFHSKHIRDFGPKLREELSHVIKTPRRRSSKWVSSSVPEERWHEPEWSMCSADYLTNNLLSPVLFEESCRHIPKNAVVIEIAPHSLLLSVLKRSLSKDCINIGLTHRNAPDQLTHLLQSIGKLYMVGLQPKVSALYPEVTLPVSTGTPFLGALATWDHSFSWNSEITATNSPSKYSKNIIIHTDESPLYESLKIEDKHFLPNSVLLSLLLKVLPSAKANQIPRGEITFSDVYIGEPVPLDRNRSVTLSVTNLLGTGKFEVLTGDRVVITGNITQSDPTDGNHQSITRYLRPVTNPSVALDRSDVYRRLLLSGYEYLPPLHTITRMKGDAKGDWEISTEWTGDLSAFIESVIQSQLIAWEASDPESLLRLKSIGSLSLRMDSLPKSSQQEIRLTSNAKTGVVSGTGVDARAFTFGESSLNQDQAPNRLRLTLDTSLSIRCLDHFADDADSGQMAYSGTDRSGVRVMGIGAADEAALVARPDPLLSWPVPETWTLEEAATVPVPFCLAYYMLKVVANVKGSDSVLVTNGLSNLGVASIAVALTCTDAVFATVSSDDERTSLQKKFHQLSDKIIVVRERCEHRLELDVLLKNKLAGVNYVVNTCQGEQIEKYLRCTGPFSYLFQVFLKQPQDGLKVTGTEKLLTHGSICGITLWNVITSCDSDKAQIKELITKGIKSGVVAPWSKLLQVPSPVKDSDDSNSCREKKCARSDTKFICKPDNSYLIVSRDVCDGLQAAEWFIKRRAKNITVVHSGSDSSSGGVSAAAKIRAMQQSASLSLQSIDSLDEQTLHACTRHLKDVDVAVVIALDDRRHGGDAPTFSTSLVQFLVRKCLEPDSRLISVSGSLWKGVEECVERSRRGMPTKILLWDGLLPSKSRQYIRLFDSLLASSSDHRNCIVNVHEDGEDAGKADKDLDDLLATLPSGQRDVAAYGETVTDEAGVTEIRSLSPPYQDVKETLPIFLLPGIKRPGAFLDKFRRSLYPTFLVQLPHVGNSTVEELASYAVPKMKSVTDGPFIIVGEQWGGCIALDLARQLDKLGYKSHVFLVSGTPTEVVEPLKFVATADETLDVSLLSRLLRIEDEEILRDLSNEKTWKNKMNYCSQLVKEELREDVVKGLDAIRCRLRAAVDFSLRSPIAGPLTVITKNDISSQNHKQLCKSRVSVYITGEEEDTLSDDVFRMIHETAVHKSLAR